MRGILITAALVLSVMACGLFVPSTEAPPPAQPTQPQPPEPTQVPAATATPAPTEVPPTPTTEPTSTPAATATTIPAPQQWNGTYTYPSTGAKQNISLLIEKVKGTTFTGKMVWIAFSRYRGAILKTNGEFVTDFGDQAEQAKWDELSDYHDGVKTGTYLKWTETEIIEGRNYTVNGWYYAHMREDGTMVAVYFPSKDAVVADAGTFIFHKVGR